MTSLCCNILTACIATSFNGFVFNVPAQFYEVGGTIEAMLLTLTLTLNPKP